MSLDVWITHTEPTQVFEGNVTHNLNKMADAAGIYKHLWRPDELGLTKAGELIEPLRAGLKSLEERPELYKVHNPQNGWGSYEGLVKFVRAYLEACEKYPDGDIGISR